MSLRSAIAWVLLAASTMSGQSWANPCALSSGGMGGTGAPAAVASADDLLDGIGGTGASAQQNPGGMGGTGAKSDNGPGGIGGTGATVDRGPGGIGGTGATADRGPGGIGGTGATADRGPGGIGGTGSTADRGPGGIGGTGAVADEGGIGGTGIVGVITGFGSICVGGVEIHYGPSTPVSSDGRRMNATQLKIGHVVQVEARGFGDSVRARSIELVHAVAGPVRGVDAKAGRLEVLGQSVRASATFIAQAQAAARAGHPVQVSGLRNRTGEIVATRVDAAPGLKEFGVIGPVQSISGNSARIGNLPIKLSSTQARELSRGQSVEICGALENGSLRAHSVETKGAAALKGRVARLVVEGLVGERRGDRLQVGDTTLDLDSRTSIVEGGDLKVDQRVVVAARVVNGKLIAERVERVRDRNEGGHGSNPGDKDTAESDQDQDGDSGDKDQDLDQDGGGSGKDADKDADKDAGKDNDSGKDAGKDAGKDSGSGKDAGKDSGSGKDSSKSDSGGGSKSERDSDASGSDARKALESGGKSDRPSRDKTRDSGRDASRPPKEPKPERPSGSSSHGGRPDRVRIK